MGGKFSKTVVEQPENTIIAESKTDEEEKYDSGNSEIFDVAFYPINELRLGYILIAAAERKIVRFESISGEIYYGNVYIDFDKPIELKTNIYDENFVINHEKVRWTILAEEADQHHGKLCRFFPNTFKEEICTIMLGSCPIDGEEVKFTMVFIGKSANLTMKPVIERDEIIENIKLKYQNFISEKISDSDIRDRLFGDSPKNYCLTLDTSHDSSSKKRLIKYH